MDNKTPISTLNIENADRIAFLITGYIRSTLTDEEKDELDDWITLSDHNVELFARLTNPTLLDEAIKSYNSFNSKKAISIIKAQLVEQQPAKLDIVGKMKWLPYAVAASLLLLMGIYVFTRNDTPVKVHSFTSLAEIKPGTGKALLTLATGETILLDSVNEKSLQAGKLGFSYDNGRLVYSPSTLEGEQGELQYHLLSIPRGAHYQLKLPDGSTVWLNAESSIRFPSMFHKTKRQIEITGEVFVDVIKNDQKPFYVTFTANNNGRQAKTEIKVLGTSFNINAYKEEPYTSIALTEGKIQLTSNTGSIAFMRKGQLAMFENGKINIHPLVNEDEMLAWKNGWFEFKNATIEAIMKQVSRWYNIDVEYKGKINYHFNASIERNVTAEQLLHLLEQTGHVHFTLQDNKIIVEP